MSMGGPQPILHFPASNIKSTFYSEIPRKMPGFTRVHHKELGLTCFHVSMKCWSVKGTIQGSVQGTVQGLPVVKGRGWDQGSWHQSPVWCRQSLLSSLCRRRTDCRHSLGWPAIMSVCKIKRHQSCFEGMCRRQWSVWARRHDGLVCRGRDWTLDTIAETMCDVWITIARRVGPFTLASQWQYSMITGTCLQMFCHVCWTDFLSLWATLVAWVL